MTHFIPGPCFPLGGAGDSVTGPAALRTLPQTVLAVHRAVGTIMEGLEAAHSAELVARGAAALATVFPFFRCPAVGARGAVRYIHCEHAHSAMLGHIPLLNECTLWGNNLLTMGPTLRF